MAEKPPIRKIPQGQKPRPGISLQQERFIGRVCVAWGALEATMQDVIWHLLDVPIDDGRIITAGADATRKIQWIDAFTKKHLKGEQLESIKAIVSKIGELRLDRNFIIHGTWATGFWGDPISCSVKEKSPDPTEVVAESFPEWRMREIWEGINESKFALMGWANALQRARGRAPPYPGIEDQPRNRGKAVWG